MIPTGANSNSPVYELDLHVLAALTGESESTVIKGLWERSLFSETPQKSSMTETKAAAILTSSGFRHQGRPELAEIAGLCVLTHGLRCLEAGGVTRALIIVQNANDRAVLARRVRAEMAERSISIEFIISSSNKIPALSACQALTAESERGFLLVSSDHLFEPELIANVLNTNTTAILLDRLPPYQNSSHTGYIQVKTKSTQCLRLGMAPLVSGADSVFAGLVHVRGDALCQSLETNNNFVVALDELAKASQLQALSTNGFKWLALSASDKRRNSEFFDDLLHTPAQPPKLLSQKMRSNSFGLLDDYYTAAPVAETPPKPRPKQSRISLSNDSRNLEDARADIVFSDVLTQQEEQDDIEATLLEEVHSNTSLGSTAVLVGLDEGACYAVAPTDTILAAWDELPIEPEEYYAAPPVCVRGSSTLLTALLRATGVDDVSDLERLALSRDQQHHVELVVERKVPLIGWIVLVLATFAQASSGLVGEFVEQGGHTEGSKTRLIRQQLALVFWRPFAATLLAIPLGVLRRLRKAYRTRLRAKRLLPPKKKNAILMPFLSKQKLAALLSIALVGFWASNALYQVAFLFASNAADVVLISNATPIIIVLMKAAGCGSSGGPIQNLELIGTGLGLFGALLCRQFAPPDALQSPRELNEPSWMHGSQRVAVLATFLCVVAKAGANVAAKDGIRAVSPLDLHVLTQVAGAVISFVLLAFFAIANRLPVITSEYGALGLLAPTANRLPAYIYSAVVVDTLGTLGYLLALKFVDPLLIAVASLFQPVCALLETALLAGGSFFGPTYAIGICFLVFGGGLIAKAEAHSAQFLTADQAVSLRPDQENVQPLSSVSKSNTRLLDGEHRAFLYGPLEKKDSEV